MYVCVYIYTAWISIISIIYIYIYTYTYTYYICVYVYYSVPYLWWFNPECGRLNAHIMSVLYYSIETNSLLKQQLVVHPPIMLSILPMHSDESSPEHVYIYMYIYIYVYIYTYLYVHMCIYIYICIASVFAHCVPDRYFRCFALVWCYFSGCYALLKSVRQGSILGIAANRAILWLLWNSQIALVVIATTTNDLFHYSHQSCIVIVLHLTSSTMFILQSPSYHKQTVSIACIDLYTDRFKSYN